jgi:predicted nucleotidyltransferase component of viral defense system
MNVVAQLPKNERRALFTETGASLGLDPFYVEKDFWVCWVLDALFDNETTGPHLTFRGGTSLSKAWEVIERFSEDVDLAMSRPWLGEAGDPGEIGITKSERDRRHKALREECRQMVREVLFPLMQRSNAALPEPGKLEVEPLERARDPFCLFFEYPGTDLKPQADYNRAAVKVELSGRADSWPMQKRTIRPYVAIAFPEQTGQPMLELSCVRPERTFWEKAALLHEQNVRPGGKDLALLQARHLYDLVQLWNANIAATAGFHELFEGVKAHRRTYFDYTWVDYETLRPDALKLVPPRMRLDEWRADYEAMQRMFFKDSPTFDEILAGLHAIEGQLATL